MKPPMPAATLRAAAVMLRFLESLLPRKAKK